MIPKNDGTTNTDLNTIPLDDRVEFIITGFGPFQDTKDNPTTTLANEIISYLSEGDILRKHLASQSKTYVLDTSVEYVTSKMDELVSQQRQESSSTITVLIHLGVHSQATKFQLESCAYNEADFRIPDEKGNQPRDQVIFPDYKLGQAFSTLLNVPRLVDELNNNNNSKNNSKNNSNDDLAERMESSIVDVNEMCVVSTDPGRFVCNYTYCYSLKQFQCARETIIHEQPQQQQSTASSNHPVRCLFVHVPPFEKIHKRDTVGVCGNLVGSTVQATVA